MCHLTYIMMKCPYPNKHGIRSYFIRCCFRQVSYL
jgi:hypothetical protein